MIYRERYKYFGYVIRNFKGKIKCLQKNFSECVEISRYTSCLLSYITVALLQINQAGSYFHTGPILNITCMMLYCISHFAYVDMKDYGMYVISASHKINAILRGV